jgi:hypothetical protein
MARINFFYNYCFRASTSHPLKRNEINRRGKIDTEHGIPLRRGTEFRQPFIADIFYFSACFGYYQ